MNINYEKAFNVLAYITDNICNKRDFSEQERESFSQLAYYFKQTILFSSNFGIQHKYSKENIEAFLKATMYHNNNFEKSYDYRGLLMEALGIEEL